MSFKQRTNNLILNAKLTEYGTKLLLSGKLDIKNIAFSDSEIDYRFGKNIYDGTNNFLLRMNKNYNTTETNFDGTSVFSLEGKVFSGLKSITAQTPSIGTFKAMSGGTNMDDYSWDYTLPIVTGYTVQPFGDLFITPLVGDSAFVVSGASGPIPTTGIVVAKMSSPAVSVTVFSGSTNVPFQTLFYHYTAQTQTFIDLERRTPRYRIGTKVHELLFYPLSGSNYYGSGTTAPSPIWSMKLLRSTIRPMADPRFDAHYERAYGAQEIGGIQYYFGFSEDYPLMGYLYYSSKFSGDVYQDQLMPNQTEIDIPHIMWYRTGIGTTNGTSLKCGVKFTDRASGIYYDNVAKTNYTLLSDSPNSNGKIVGRVYYNLQIIIFFDQDLLETMFYGSNRNWIMPPLNVELVEQVSNEELIASGRTGLCSPGYVYYVTYLTHSYVIPAQLGAIGHRQVAPCAYVQRIEGKNGSTGEPMYLKASFPPDSFPFLRAGVNSVYSGTGWCIDVIEIMTQEISKEDDEANGGLLGLNQFAWRHSVNDSEGRYGEKDNHFALDPIEVNEHDFFITREGYDESTTINYPIYISHDESNTSALLNNYYHFYNNNRIGTEEIFFGNVTTKTIKNTYYTVIKTTILDNQLNTSNNATYMNGQDTFITTIHILDASNKVVAIAKPDRPIKKNIETVLDLQIEIGY